MVEERNEISNKCTTGNGQYIFLRKRLVINHDQSLYCCGPVQPFCNFKHFCRRPGFRSESLFTVIDHTDFRKVRAKKSFRSNMAAECIQASLYVDNRIYHDYKPGIA